MFKVKVNGKEHQFDVPADTPVLWVLREELGLTGTKFGCGIAVCGACTIHVDGEAKRSCNLAVSDVHQKNITTIEGLSPNAGPSVETLHPVQQAWIEENVPQCGYCQSGQIMSAVALLAAKRNPTDTEIDAVMSANLCRCGTYPRIRKAIKKAATKMAAAQPPATTTTPTTAPTTTPPSTETAPSTTPPAQPKDTPK